MNYTTVDTSHNVYQVLCENAECHVGAMHWGTPEPVDAITARQTRNDKTIRHYLGLSLREGSKQVSSSDCR